MKNMRRMNTKRTGFTLIELLVVITIIGLLTAILIPSIRGALRAAKRARCLAQISDLDGAVKRYFAEYGKMPVLAGDNGGPDQTYTGSGQAAVILILLNENNDPDINPKKIVFLDLDPSSFEVKTKVEMLAQLTAGTAYTDPWGGDYGILMDLNFDDRITGTAFGNLRMKTAVYSGGEDQLTDDPPYKTW